MSHRDKPNLQTHIIDSRYSARHSLPFPAFGFASGFKLSLKLETLFYYDKYRFCLHECAMSCTVQAADEQCARAGNSTSCYCIPGGQCFAVVQPVDIDNCQFDRFTDDPLELRYTVTNQAGLNASGTIDVRHSAFYQSPDSYIGLAD